ncbi:TetR/AcrR family transcriptional regulator [Phenylobacterium sp.]|uniref:TetR/AcrR family transcriptional regulator n=1 Tax=Phenylobacterium sp. TaxID=1871053 RepID=UPI002733BC2E|nr:TetR/AcrR family transcriptional regulator [Phenylobacterium sp.]MDP3854906.1 helix-turn-helix domain-containing protein [Phenylobacterium sp.]
MTAEPITEGRRRPKGDKRQRTRASLLEAARELIREKGYERTTLQDVAQRAGMTSGAIYGNFKNRDDLFMALATAYWAPIKPMIRRGSSFAEKMRALAEATIAVIPERRDAAFGRLTGMAHTLNHEELRAQVREVTGRSFSSGAAWLATVADDGGLPMPADILVVVIHAMTEGLLFQRFLTPDLVPDEVFYAAFAALAGEPTPG